jgi:uncharacterized protein YdhG (YjbR/CyaY superfamily)
MGTELAVQILPYSDSKGIDPMSHFIDTINEISDYTLYDRGDSDIVGLTIRNDENLVDKAVGIRFRRKDQLSAEEIWSVFENVIQSNARFNSKDKLTIQIHAVRMPSGSGFPKAKGRP